MWRLLLLACVVKERSGILSSSEDLVAGQLSPVGHRLSSASGANVVAIAQYQKLEVVAEWNRVQSSLQLNIVVVVVVVVVAVVVVVVAVVVVVVVVVVVALLLLMLMMLLLL